MNALEVREHAKAFLHARPDLTSADLAAHSVLGTSTVKNFINGLGSQTPRVQGEVARVLRLAEQGEILQPGGGRMVMAAEQPVQRVRRVVKKHEFYVTETVRRVGQVLDYCVEHAAIGVITGDYGVGKTEAVAAWRRGSGRNVDSVCVEFNEFTRCNKVSFIQGLAASLGLDSRCGTTSAARLFETVIDHLRAHPCLLIFDQCEQVQPRICQLIRQIWDRTREAGVGVAMLAAPVLLVRLRSMADLGALSSRVGIWAPLAGLLKGEMAAIVRQEGVTEVEDSAFDLWWKATGGSMRRLMRSLDLVKAKHAGKRVTERTIGGVAGHLWGMAISEGE